MLRLVLWKMSFREGFGGVVLVGVLLSDIQGCWLRWGEGLYVQLIGRMGLMVLLYVCSFE